jgi:hypothetical protein
MNGSEMDELKDFQAALLAIPEDWTLSDQQVVEGALRLGHRYLADASPQGKAALKDWLRTMSAKASSAVMGLQALKLFNRQQLAIGAVLELLGD